MQFMTSGKTKFRNRAGSITYHAINMRGHASHQGPAGPAQARKFNGPAPALWKHRRRGRSASGMWMNEGMATLIACGLIGGFILMIGVMWGF